MTYEEFKKEFMLRLAKKEETSEQIGEYRLYLDGETSDDPGECNFIKATNIKYNKIESDVLIGDFLKICHKTDVGSEARYEMKYLFRSFSKEGWDLVWDIIDDSLNYAKKLDVKNVMKFVDDYEVMKDRIILRAINYTDNRYALKDYVYKQIGDMALVLYFFISDTKEFGLTTAKVDKKILETWGKEKEEVMETALVNSNMRSVPRMYNSPREADNPGYQTGAYMAVGSKCQLAVGMRNSTFTTYPHLNGATSFWYPGVQEKIAEMAGGDYYVAFTGIHDFHVHPAGSISPRQVLANLKHMNRINGKDETLSRKVYLYQADTRELKALDL